MTLELSESRKHLALLILLGLANIISIFVVLFALQSILTESDVCLTAGGCSIDLEGIVLGLLYVSILLYTYLRSFRTRSKVPWDNILLSVPLPLFGILSLIWSLLMTL